MATLTVYALLLFSDAFPSRRHAPKTRSMLFFGVAAGIMTTLSFSPWIVTHTSLSPSGSLVATYGVLYPVFAVYVVACVGYSLLIITKKLRASRGAARQQMMYLFAALIVPGLAATLTNLIVPLTTGRSHLSRYGPMFSVMMIAMIAHAIIRHRLMDIRLVIRRGLVYLVSATISAALFMSTIGFVALQSPDGLAGVPLSLQVLGALVIALVFQPIKNWIQGWLDRYVYREAYDYQRTLREASRTIGSILDLNTLLRYLCEITGRTIKPDKVLAFVADETTRHFRLAHHESAVGISLEELQGPVAVNALAAHLARSHRPLVRDDASRTRTEDRSEAATAELARLKADLAVPMLSENELLGFLVLGEKLSGDPYFSDDVELLATLTNQAGIAVNNARLYGQVVLINEYVENILRTMDSGVVTIDSDGHVALCNDTAAQLIGLPTSRLRSSVVDQLPLSLASELRATLFDGRPRLQVETSLPSSVARPIPIVCSTSALRDRQGQIGGALVVFSDVSRLKELEDDKRRAERLAAFGTLVSGIAHEIKNPLVAIRTFAELLPERFADTDFREDFSKVVINEIDRIDDLVGRLRGLAAPSVQITGPMDIREPIVETLALLRAQFELARISVTRDFQDEQPLVQVESSQLKQLFLNLFLNATEAMGSGGSLTVRIWRKQTSSADWIVTEVSDTGEGIPDSIRRSVFDPFFTTKSRGSGLGLAICRGITDAHRGTIRAEQASVQPGTTLVVELPAAQLNARSGEEVVLRGTPSTN